MMDGILSKIRRFMSDNCMTDPEDRIVLGVSGGADSMCLLFALWEIFSENALSVIHVEHGIRGNDSLEDAAFVKSVCESLHIPCRIISVNCPEIAEQKGESLEEAGRNARYEAFLSADADCIAVAHHMDDQAETVLANLFRGSALHGICGMSPVSKYKGKKLIRPLLGITRNEILQFLIDRNISWREDATNEDVSYSRNRIRAKIMPEAEAVNARAVAHVCKTADYLQSLECFLEEETEKAFCRCSISDLEKSEVSLGEEKDDKQCREIQFDAAAILNLPAFLAGEVLLRGIAKIHGGVKDIGAVHLEELRSLCNKQSGRMTLLPYQIRAVRSGTLLILKKEDTQMRKEDAKKRPLLPDISQRIIEREEPVSKADIPNEIYTKWFDYDKIHGEIVLRTREQGDVINLSYGSKKLQDYMVNEKIPQSERDAIPILADEESVLWIIGYRISHEHKVTPETRRILEVTIHFSERYGY